MSNISIRTAIIVAGLKHYEVAEALGVTEEYFSKILRKELPPERQKQIISTISELSQTKAEVAHEQDG